MMMGTIGRLIVAGKQNREANKINPVDTTYTESPYAQEQLALARLRMNSGMTGADGMRRTVQQNAANVVGTAQRNANSGNQVLAAAAAAQEGANQAAAQQQQMEFGADQQNLSNLTNAQQTMTEEKNKVYQDQLRKYMLALQQKTQLKNASRTNMMDALDSYDDGIVRVAAAVINPASAAGGK